MLLQYRFWRGAVLWTSGARWVFCPLGITFTCPSLHVGALRWERVARLGDRRLILLLICEHMLLDLIRSSRGGIKWYLKTQLTVTFFLTDSSSWKEIVRHLWCLKRLRGKSTSLIVWNLVRIKNLYMMTLSFVRMTRHYWGCTSLLLIEILWFIACSQQSSLIFTINIHFTAEKLIACMTSQLWLLNLLGKCRLWITGSHNLIMC